jgi:glycerol-3-phosphate dehydrogenase (NAD(P)+)
VSYIAVIGAGSWGTTLASLLAEKDYDVSLWVNEKDLAEEMRETGVNSLYLPDYPLPEGISIYSDMVKAVDRARYVLSVVPTQYTRSVLERAATHIHKDAVLINASKGIEKGTYKTVSTVIREVTGRAAAALSGPSFSAEVAKKLPTAVTLACEDYKKGLLLQEIFTTDYFRVYTHHDVVGVELGGALKNVIAVASGISEGMGLGNSARSALITRGLAEITRLGVRLGASERTFSGLSGMGDLVLTCSSHLSRNYTVGFKLGQGQKLEDIVASTKSVAEGVATAEAAYELSRNHNVEMPIVEQVYRVIYEGKEPRQAVQDLMTRSLKAEF